jgi:hypothetical protein
MEGSQHTDKYKEIAKDFNYDASCTHSLLPVSDLQKFKCLTFVAQSAPRSRQIFSFETHFRSFTFPFKIKNKRIQETSKAYIILIQMLLRTIEWCKTSEAMFPDDGVTQFWTLSVIQE